jgi:tetratricopeptide (TPR) repeat protein
MKTNSLPAGILTAGLALALAILPATASAQIAGVSGRVLDEAGNPVADAVIVISNPSGVGTTELKTNAKGEYQTIGIPPVDYQIKATKGSLVGQVDRIKLGLGGPTAVPDIILKPGADAPAGAAEAPAEMSPEEIEAINKRNAEMKLAFDGAQADVAAGNYAAALTKLDTVATAIPDCDVCYVQMGDIHMNHTKDLAEAEAAFKKAIELNPSSYEPYGALASIYNSQQKFDLATEMGAKASELMAASGGTDPVAFLNQGIILWNQGKTTEAKAQFQRATELDARNANAHYWLGMALVNEGNLPEAAKHMEEYLELAPTGENADTAKAILESVK